MTPILIGIGGKKHCGKDTFASMLFYINKVGPAAAKYNVWYEFFEKPTFSNKLMTVHFADTLKDCCSIMFQIERAYFDNLEYKDKKYYSFRDNTFIDDKNITVDHQRLSSNDFLDFKNFAEKIANNPDAPLIKLRNLMTVYADVMKNVYGENIFVNSTIKKANKICTDFGFCLIPDVRFNNEAYAIKNVIDADGFVIKIIRPDEPDDENSLHNSEICNFKEDYTIINDSNLMTLFYKAINVYNKIIREVYHRNSIKMAISDMKEHNIKIQQ